MKRFTDVIQRSESLTNRIFDSNNTYLSSIDAAALVQTKETLLQQLDDIDHLPLSHVHALLQGTVAQLLRCEAALAPIRRLPQELLSLIFIHLKTLIDPFLMSEAAFFMGTIFLVCRWWRHVARDTPELWTRIDCLALAHPDSPLYRSPSYLGENPIFPSDFRLPVISKLLRMAKGLPLTISHEPFPFFTLEVGDAALHALMSDVLFHAYHWGSIRLHGSGEMFAGIPAVELPLLEKADVSLRGHDLANSLKFLSHATKLKHARLALSSQVAQSVEVLNHLLPAFPSLTSLHFTYDGPSHIPLGLFLSALRSCRGTLVHLDLQCNVIANNGTYEVVDMMALRRMCLVSGAYTVMRVLRTSSLMGLSLVAPQPVADDIVPTLFTFLSRPPANNLQRLCLVRFPSCHKQFDVFMACLRKLASLAHLQITNMPEPQHGYILTRRLVRRLSRIEDDPPLLPKLTSINFGYRNRGDIDGMRDAVDALVRSRSRSQRVLPLRDVIVDIPGTQI
ncbi:hypothetical protein GGF50DRAFT_67867 [Schizophyllum commune]